MQAGAPAAGHGRSESVYPGGGTGQASRHREKDITGIEIALVVRRITPLFTAYTS